MTNIAIIPCRGGSKGIPKKNLQLVHGIPLVVRSINTCFGASLDHVFVSTDDEVIADYARAAGAEVIQRPNDLALDDTSTDQVLQHAIQELLNLGHSTADKLFLLQATSPFTKAETLRTAIEKLEINPMSGVFTVQDWHGFIWNLQEQIASPYQHDHLNRQRRQALAPQVLETGGIYGASISSFLNSKVRFVDPLISINVDRKESIEIDSFDDLALCNSIEDVSNKPAQGKVKVVFTDFDGVMTDNRVIQLDNGEFGSYINRSDGIGIQEILSHGIPVIVITGEKNGAAFGRARKMNIECYYSEDKLSTIVKYCAQNSIKLAEVAFIGNDLNDLGPIATCGWTFVPYDAYESVSKHARRILKSKGGGGVIREVSSLLSF